MQQIFLQIFLIKILRIIQFGITCLATIYTPIDQCIYGFFAFAIGCTDAILHLMISQNLEAKSVNADEKQATIKTNILLSVIESIHDYLPLGLINMELHRLSSQYPLLSFVFCLPFGLDILSRLFDNGTTYVADEKVLMYLKKFNTIIHSISIGSLAKRELNIWFMCVWLATLIVSGGIFLEASYFYVGKFMKLIGYIFVYIFALIGIYDDDFLSRWEWFNIHAMDYQ
ncbi:hypothetical protein CVS40_7358 [Lucilia cuprina]|nr:hypothetical protein CVS40_7358 [Lucilia cuprina]